MEEGLRLSLASKKIDGAGQKEGTEEKTQKKVRRKPTGWSKTSLTRKDRRSERGEPNASVRNHLRAEISCSTEEAFFTAVFLAWVAKGGLICVVRFGSRAGSFSGKLAS